MLNMVARDVMTSDVLWVNSETPVAELISLFVEKKISGAPIVNAEGEMVGVVSLRDVLQYGAKVIARSEHNRKTTEYYVQGWDAPLSHDEVEWFHQEIDQTQPVSEIMNPMVYTVDVDTPVQELADTMLRGRVHRMVVTENDELAGIVSSLDMMKVVSDLPLILDAHRKAVIAEIETSQAKAVAAD